MFTPKTIARLAGFVGNGTVPIAAGTASMWHQIAQQHEKSDRQAVRRQGSMSRGKSRGGGTHEEDEDSDEDSFGYEDDFSSGIDLPLEVTSGNILNSPRIQMYSVH